MTIHRVLSFRFEGSRALLSFASTVLPGGGCCQEQCSRLLTLLSVRGGLVPVNAPQTARARARAELTAAIKDVARRHLAEEGAAALSLRAVARELGMASSAVYRYFASRDELLTALIVDSYDSLGAYVEAADAAGVTADGDDLAERWLEACRAVRRWALDNPQEYALIYGSPVPGYRAPQDTIGPATRAPAVMAAGLRVAAAQGLFAAAGPAPPGPGGPPLVPLPPGLAADMEALGPFFGGVPSDVAARALVAWSAVFGMVTFELFGQYDNVIAARAEFFDYAARALLLMVVMPSATS
jgi:AcrR family transcriptional regulator